MIRKTVLFLLIFVASAYGEKYVINVDDESFKCSKMKKLNAHKGELKAQEAFKFQNEGGLIIDIRSKMEFDYDHVKDSIHVPAWETDKATGGWVWQDDFLDKLEHTIDTAKKKNPTLKVMLICRTGSRSKCLASYLASEQDLENVYNVTWGFRRPAKAKNPKHGWVDQLPEQVEKVKK